MYICLIFCLTSFKKKSPIALFIETKSLQYFPLSASEMKVHYSSLGHVSLRIIFFQYITLVCILPHSLEIFEVIDGALSLILYPSALYLSLQSYQIVTAIDT